MSVVLHIGLPKTGTTYLQRVLAENREHLRSQGVLYPFVRPGAHFHGAVEIRGSEAKFGLDAAQISGTWSALCAKARAFEGTAIISHEVLAGATPDQIATALTPLAGLDVRVLVTARDLGRQATAHWQEQVKLGSSDSFAEFETKQLRADTGRDLGPAAGGLRPRFWHAQDPVHALNRWTASLGADAGHLVVGPPPGTRPEELWRRFAAAAGIGDTGVTPVLTSVNASLTGPDIALLRAVNRELGQRMRNSDRLRLVKRGWAETELATRQGIRPRTPASLEPLLSEVTNRWVAEISEHGYSVHGDLRELVPTVGTESDPPPDVSTPPDADPAAIAKGFLEVAGKQQVPDGGRGGLRFGRRRRR